MTNKLGTQNERVEARLRKFGYITRNSCLSQVPAITRLSARIADLEAKGFVFRTEDTGRDYIYHLVSAPGDGCEMCIAAAKLVREFDDYRPTQTV